MAYASDVFAGAMSVMDELSSTGQAQTTDTEEYKLRTPAIVNIMAVEYRIHSGVKGSFVGITGIDDYLVGIDDAYAIGVMPYGLAANLLVDENPTAAGFYQQRYEELRSMYTRNSPAEFEPIADVYGGIEYSN